MDATKLTTRIVGWQVRSADGSAVAGLVEGVRPRGMRLHRIPGHPGRHGYVPAEAIGRVDERTDTLFLREGIAAADIAGAPPPPDERPDAWHKSDDWWADLLGHYGLYEAEGRGSEPFLHPGQR